ncbi:MAG: acyloxyacyl hydrolase [Variovorax sp.]|nr:MAG: acyloxyacyl hydrolase [Variovorax sp.]
MTRWMWMGGVVMALAAFPALAQSDGGSPPYGVYAEGGRTLEGGSPANAASIGFTFPFGHRWGIWGGSVTGYGDVFVSEWRARDAAGEGRRTYTQIGAIATWRYRFADGASPWFVDGGIGVSLMDKLYATPDRAFSTRFQFTEVLGIGRNFGANGAHELSLRVQHFSNAGIKKPNPGENFVRLRYQYHF